jgi:hypothetical protein
MKSCPTCHRTFEDTLTFCLVDGSILSAPFDPRATHEQPGARDTGPPPTEVMPPPTQAAANAPQYPTIPAPPPAYAARPQKHHAVNPAQYLYPSHGQAMPAGAPQQKKTKRLWPLPVALFGLWFIGAIGGIGGGLIHLLLLAAAVTSLTSFLRAARR